MGAFLAPAYLTGIMVTDFLVPQRYSLIEFYGVTAIIAAATLGWRLTTAAGMMAVAGGFITGEYNQHTLSTTSTQLSIGSVGATAVVAIIVAVIRERRERRLAAITEVAEVAESAIVSHAPISLPDLEVAHVYRSATNLASIGGDLYEAVSTPYGSRIIVGDARGKGLPAVQLAAVVLGAFRHAALSEPDLSRLVTDLDRTVAAFASHEDFVTALIMEVDELEVRIVCCGHPWPLIGPPGYVRPVQVEASLPLGLGGERPVQVKGFPTRQLLVLYTDGLVEARNAAGEMLDIDVVAAAIQTWEPEVAMKVIEKACTDHLAGPIQDDVTILAIKRLAS